MPDFGKLFDDAGCRGSLHVVRLGDGAEIGHEPDRPRIMASVVKVPIALAFFSSVATGETDPAQAVRIEPDDATPGPVGISRFMNAATLSLQDLSYLMLTISDNAATDAVTAAVGLDRINRAVRAVGCDSTVVVSDLRTMLDGVAADLGFADYAQLLAAQRGDLGPIAAAASTNAARIDACGALDPATATRTTARDVTRLLSAVWNDQAGPPDACASLRAVMAEQVTRRLGPAVADGGTLAAKSGGLFGRIRNEVGVIADPDGAEFAIAVLTTAFEPFRHENKINRAMASAVQIAVEELRASRTA
jgi:beta-lactamase class A